MVLELTNKSNYLSVLNRYAVFVQLQLQHSSTSSFGRTTQRDEELSRLNYRMEVISNESEKLREALQRTQQELGNNRPIGPRSLTLLSASPSNSGAFSLLKLRIFFSVSCIRHLFLCILYPG